MNRLFSLIALISISIVAFGQQKVENCPFEGGRENCTGFCGRFTDENKDGYCDYSKLTASTQDLEKDKAKDEKVRQEKRKNKQEKKCCKALEGKCKENNGSCVKEGGCSTATCTNYNAEKKATCQHDKAKTCDKANKDSKTCCEANKNNENNSSCSKEKGKTCANNDKEQTKSCCKDNKDVKKSEKTCTGENKGCQNHKK